MRAVQYITFPKLKRYIYVQVNEVGVSFAQHIYADMTNRIDNTVSHMAGALELIQLSYFHLMQDLFCSGHLPNV